MYILPQIAQMTQRNAVDCIISQRLYIEVNVVIVVCLRKSARSAGDIGVSSVAID